MNKRIRAIYLFTFFFFTFILFEGYGQSSGPTAPEYSSFEVFTAKNPVQLQTGDFTYVIPLMIVPSPEGEFPISLHYHAGIEPEQEATWVGLGWNLNVGAINRYVNLFPDDLQGELDESYTYWEGGNTKVTKTAFKFISPFFYQYKAKDTFKGSRSFTASSYWQYSNNNGQKHFQVNYEQIVWDFLASVSANPEVVAEESVARQIAKKMAGPVINALVMQSLYTLAEKWGLTNQSSTPQSTSTRDITISTASSAITSFSLTSALTARLITSNPIVGVLAGFKKKSNNRYWIDDRVRNAQTGSLNWLAPDRDNYTQVYDASNLYKKERSTYYSELSGSISSLGGILPSYDYYQVLASGVGGNIVPDRFESTNIITGNYEDKIVYEEVDTTSKHRVFFRYQNDFSNTFTLEDASAGVYLKPGYEATYPDSLFDDNLKRLASGKHIEWFTNGEINDGTAASKGFMAWDAGSTREYLKYGSTVEQKIGGFMITDETGTTYHFSLPVYSYDAFQRYEQIDPPKDKKMYKHSYIPAAYAYTWLLTGITGPGFHNTYEDGLGTPGLDEEDEGFWVRFDYGLWTTQHKWRTPFEGFETDVDGEYQFYSRGIKELYYLDKVVTRTHTALFIKEVRRDGKGISEPYLFEYTDVNGTVRTTGEYNEKGATYTHSDGSEVAGGFSDDISISWEEDENIYQVKGVFKPISALRLKEIVLFKNNRLNDLLDDQGVLNRNLKANGNTWNTTTDDYTTYKVYINGSQVTSQVQASLIFDELAVNKDPVYHTADNVIDVDDIEGFKDAFYAASLSSVLLDADYSLMDNTPNSLDNSVLYEDYESYDERSDADVRYGKLTLNALQFQGRGGSSVIPATRFSYKGTSISYPSFELDGVTYTKKDQWGYYNAGLDPVIFAENKPFARLQSESSAKQKDAWSLASVQTPSGARMELDYESDSYKTVTLNTPISVPMSAMEVGVDTLFFAFAESDNYLSALRSELGRTGKYEATFTVNLAFKGISTVLEVCGETTYSDANNGVVPFFEIDSLSLDKDDYGIDKEGRVYVTGDKVSDAFSFLFEDTDIMINYICETNDYSVCIPASSCSCGDGCYQLPVLEVEPAQASLNLSLTDEWLTQNPQPGGDIRLKSVRITDKDDASKVFIRTDYHYDGGYTSHDPIELAFQQLYEVTLENTLPEKAFDKQEDSKDDFKMAAMGESRDVFSMGDLIPSPGIMYSDIEVFQINVDDTTQYLNKEAYSFTSPSSSAFKSSKSEDIANMDPPTLQLPGYPAYDTLKGNVSIVKLSNLNAFSGLLKTYLKYNGADELVYSETKHYLHEELSSSSKFLEDYDALLQSMGVPGRLDQQYYTQRRTIKDDADYMQMIVTELEYFPSLLISEEATDLLNNLKTEITYDDFDLLTGQVKKTISTNSYGEVYSKEMIPAYTKYSGMGSKFFSTSNANILSVGYGNVTTLLRPESDSEEVISASATVWSDQITENEENWQPAISYTWAPNDEAVELTPLPADYQIADDHWKLNSYVTKMDVNGMVEEAGDINSTLSVLKVDLSGEHPLLQAGNASYDEVAFSSAEYFDTDQNGSEGGVSRDIRSVIASGVAHTGNYSLGAGYGRGAFEFTLAADENKADNYYRVSVWVYMPGYSENELENAMLIVDNGTETQTYSPASSKKSKEWYLIEALVRADGEHDIVISCNNDYPYDGRLIYFDDFRFQPVDAGMACYVYDPTTDELIYVFDNNHLYTKYVYDDQGRLSKVYREIFYTVDQLVNQQIMHYKN